MQEKKAELYSGKAKTLFITNDPDCLIVHFRDDATAFDGTKKARLNRKGMVNNYFNAFIMQALEKAGIALDSRLQVNAETSEEEGYKATLKLLQKRIPFDAIFGASDLIAIGAIKALEDDLKALRLRPC